MTIAKQLSKAVPIPPHIPASAVYDFDMFQDPAYNLDPHARILDLLNHAPAIFWTPRNGGHWITLSYNANFTVSRDPESFSSEMISHSKIKVFAAIEKVLVFFRLKNRTPLPYPILLDPPLHTKYRLPLQKVFAPKAVKLLEGRVRISATDLIEKTLAQGHCEFMSAIAEPLPVKLFLQIFGLPAERMAEFRKLLKQQLSTNDPESDTMKTMATLQDIAAAMRDTFLDRKHSPQDDIISHLWRTKIDGRPMTMEDMENYGVLLFIAGLDTVMQAMGFAIRHLAMDQALQTRLRSNPAQIGDAIEEILRRYSFAMMSRRVNKDLEILDIKMKKDDKIWLFLHGANLDPEHFTNSHLVDIDREDKAHIAFNAGPHRCLGSHLARMELRVLYEEFLSRVPQFHLDPEQSPTFNCGFVIGVKTLHLTWNNQEPV